VVQFLMAFGDKADWSDPTLYSTVLQDCEPTSWNPYFCDVIPRDSCKSAGVEKMLQYFGILPEETMAFGDGDNDISMIRYCKIGVAMGNASSGCQSHCRLCDYRCHRPWYCQRPETFRHHIMTFILP